MANLGQFTSGKVWKNEVKQPDAVPEVKIDFTWSCPGATWISPGNTGNYQWKNRQSPGKDLKITTGKPGSCHKRIMESSKKGYGKNKGSDIC